MRFLSKPRRLKTLYAKKLYDKAFNLLTPSSHLPHTFLTPSSHLPHTFLTPSSHLPHTFLVLSMIVFDGSVISLPPISSCGHTSVRSPGILMSKSSSSLTKIILISLAAKKRPGHAWLPYPHPRFDSLVVTNWLRAWSLDVPPCRSL
jgi:hypothetical protein